MLQCFVSLTRRIDFPYIKTFYPEANVIAFEVDSLATVTDFTGIQIFYNASYGF